MNHVVAIFNHKIIQIRKCHDAIEKHAEAVNNEKQTLSKERMETATIKSKRCEAQRDMHILTVHCDNMYISSGTNNEILYRD